jgi:hypothetical protein
MAHGMTTAPNYHGLLMPSEPQITCGFDAIDLTIEFDSSRSTSIDLLFHKDTETIFRATYRISKQKPPTWNGPSMQRYLEPLTK